MLFAWSTEGRATERGGLRCERLLGLIVILLVPDPAVLLGTVFLPLCKFGAERLAIESS